MEGKENGRDGKLRGENGADCDAVDRARIRPLMRAT